MSDKPSKLILDATCGGRSIWFNKQHPDTIYCDIRKEHHEGIFGKVQGKQQIDISPDVICDFTDLPFEDNTFYLCVFDPPHVCELSQKSWIFKKYGTLPHDWHGIIKNGFNECMRVLRPGGTLIFKWADISISTRELIDAIGIEPLFGHRSGKKATTHWLAFIKPVEEMMEGK